MQLPPNNQDQQWGDTLLDLVVRTAVDGIVVCDADGVIQDYSKSCAQLFQYGEADVIGQNIGMLFTPACASTVICQLNLLKQLGSGGSRVVNEVTAQRQDGSPFPISFALGEGRLHGKTIFLGIVQDLSERNAHEEQAAFLGAIVEGSNDAIIGISRDGIIRSWNRVAETIYGYTAADVVGMRTRDFSARVVPPENFDEETARIERILAGEVIAPFETVRIRKDGSRIDVQVTIAPVRARNGDVLGISSTVRDITDRHAQEAQKALISQIVGASTDAILSVGLNGTVLSWNRGATAMLGYDEEEVIGKTTNWLLSRIVPPELLEFELGNTANAAKGARIPAYDTVRIRKDGRRVPVSTNIMPIQDSDGRIIGVSRTLRDISEAKRTEEALRQSLERLERVLDNSTVGAIFWDLDTGTMIDANATFLKLMGYSRDEVDERKLHWQTLTPPEYMEISKAEVEKFLLTGRVGPYEKEFFCKDGSRKWLLFAGSSLGGNQCVEFCVDISDRKRTEAALRESERQFRTLANAIPQLCWMAHADGWIFWYNERWYQYTGTTPQQMEGWGWQSVHDREVLPEVLRRYRASIATGQPFEMTFPLRGADGIYRHFLTRMMPVLDDDGQVIRWFGTNTDITEQRQIQDALRQSEERYRMLHESMRDAFVQTTTDGHILDLNDAYCDLLGYSADDLRSMTYQDLTPERWHPVDRDQVHLTLTRGYSDAYEKEYRRKDGTIIPVELRVMLSRDGEGRPESIWAIVRDLTERKHYDQHLRKMRDELAHVGRLSELGQVSAGIAHELNQPLAAMLNYSNVAKRLIATKEVADLERALGAIAKATEQAERAGTIIRRMRGFIEKRETNRAIEDINSIAEDAVAFGLIGAHADGIITNLQLDPNLPPVLADRLQIQQVLVNLLRNAVEAMAGSPDRVVTLATRLNGEREVEVSVRDSGPGMTKDVADRLFMPFFTTKPGGMGIGLVISQAIVEAHGGHIAVETAPGAGSLFHFRIPVAPRHTD
jgi:two-component system sensor kinase FixL